LGRLVEALSTSPFWKDTVVFSVEDDSQAGPDHVDSHRSVLLVVSAWNRPVTISRFVNTTDVLATIEEILGAGSPSPFGRYGRTLSGLFADAPDLAPYRALTPSVPPSERNVAEGFAGSGHDVALVDQGDDDAFNRELWGAIKGAVPYPEAAALALLDQQRRR